ncbi:MAG: serine/threonine protein kinase [Myxococcales bacterium]|nr:serine/threonine protein kinase [Myxococcales bacterium]
MGKVLGGRYEILKQLAAGGMATVHLGRLLGVGGFERLVAIKIMHAHIGGEPEFVTMFLDEARLAARIRHPNVVPTLDVEESPDGLFLVMEYIEGASLHQILKASGGLPGAVPLPIVLRMMIDTLAGLHCAHELTDDEGHPLSLVHRDVTPANILLGADGVARLTDFGVARAESRLSSTRGGQVKGKIPYMPPEQIMSEDLDRRCDIYAAGAVFWEALIGRRVFQADNDGAILQGILAGAPATPRQIDPAIPEPIDQVCMRALARKRAERFASAAEFSDAIEDAAHRAGVSIASARAVAAFVQASGAFQKIQPKELAALKQGAASAAGRQPVPSRPTGSGSGAVSFTQEPKSSPTQPSQVTSAGSALSAPQPAPIPSSRRVAPLIAGFVAVGVVVGLAVFALQSRGPRDVSPAGAAAAAVVPPGSTNPDSSVSAAPPPQASAAPLVTASASAAAPATADQRPPAGKPGPASTAPANKKPPPGAPKPGATSYDPDRL